MNYYNPQASLIMAIAEQDLVTLLRNRDESAFSYLYDLYSGALYGILLEIVPEQEIAGKILEKTFTQAWCTIATYDDSHSRLFTWLQNIARKLASEVSAGKKDNYYKRNK